MEFPATHCFDEKSESLAIFFQGLQQSRHRRRVFYPFLLASSEGAGIR